MNEFIKKLIGGLEEQSKKWLDKWNEEMRKGKYDYYSDGMNDAFDEAIEIVNQLAEEYNNDFCEWKMVPYYRIPDCGTKHIVAECLAKNFKYCPYCGKKIKVVD